MAMNFPLNPSANDTYTYAGVVYQWDGTKWKTQVVAGPNSVSTSTISGITGIIKGAAGNLAQATAGTDYVDVGGGSSSSTIHLCIVSALPESPTANTLYFVTES